MISPIARFISQVDAVPSMMVCHLMEPLTISLAFSRFTRHTAEHISCQTRLRIMKPVRRLVISSYPGVCSKPQLMPAIWIW
ncbi:Uncharacterised protein [Segatella copri]|nr:Uncharacterised protein [Segatella copri]